MERSEPSLVPEWLRGAGSSPVGGISNHQFASSNSGRRLSSSSGRNSSTNGSPSHEKNFSRSYSSSSRKHRERETERSLVSDQWNHDYYDTLTSAMFVRIEKDPLRCSHPTVPRMQGEVFPRRGSTKSRGENLSSNEYVDGLSVDVTAGIQKVLLEKDFPSLGSEEKPTSSPATPELSRVPSPGLNRAFQGLPLVNSVISADDSSTSGLAEVPVGVVSNNTGSLPALQPTAPTSVLRVSNGTEVLNMAEALVQAPLRSPSSQSPAHNERLEELAVIQSKRLIPMTPSMLKCSVLNPSDKLKPKTVPRSNQLAVTPKNGNIRVEGLNTSLTGKLLVLKFGRENGAFPASKDVPSLKANVNNRHVTVQSTGVPTVAPILSKTPINSKLAGERKTQAQSRTDFFNSVRKKSVNSRSVSADSSPVPSSVITERLDGEHNDVASDHVSLTTGNGVIVKYNGDASTMMQGSAFPSDEEQEFAFMRSLGWEPDSGVDEGLTAEEIGEFYKKYMRVIPTLKLCQVVREGLASKLEGSCLNGSSSD